MGTSTTPSLGGFTDQEIQDVTRSAAIGLGIKYDELTDAQKQGYVAAARGALTGERPKGFAAHLYSDFRPADKRSPAENAEFEAAQTTAQATESEFWKFARDEFDRRRTAESGS